MKERTKAYTLARLRHHVVPLLGRKRVSEVDAGEIERFVVKVTAGKTASDEKLGPRKRIIVRGGEGAARKVARDLSAVYRFAIRRGIVDSNPVQKAAIRRTDNHRERYLSLQEIVRLGRAFDELAMEGASRPGQLWRELCRSVFYPEVGTMLEVAIGGWVHDLQLGLALP